MLATGNAITQNLAPTNYSHQRKHRNHPHPHNKMLKGSRGDVNVQPRGIHSNGSSAPKLKGHLHCPLNVPPKDSRQGGELGDYLIGGHDLEFSRLHASLRGSTEGEI